MHCHNSCNGCSQKKKKCTNCASNYFKVEGDDNNYCYLPEEIIYLFGKNYYLDSVESKYKKCDSLCSICSGPNSSDCLKCKDGYYFINGICKLNSLIEEQNPNSFLQLGGDTFEICDSNCKTCNFSSILCTSCNTGLSIFEDNKKCFSSYVGYYSNGDENPNFFKKCDISCKICSVESDKCSQCSDTYYFLDDSSSQKCINQKIKKEYYPNYYFKTDENVFKLCDISCKTCEDSDTNDKCIECNDHYLFYEGGGQICVSENIREINGNAYYYNEVLKELRKCHSSCKTCKDGTKNNNCSECAVNYAFIDNENDGKCVSVFLSLLENYYSVTISGGISVVYKKCYEFCKKCNSYQTNPIMCTVCNEDKGYYKHTSTLTENEEQCFPNTTVKNKYFNGNDYSDSSPKCLYSNYETHLKDKCIECHNKLGFFGLDHDDKTCENIIPLDHYIYDNRIIKRCAYECASCTEGPTETSTNCDICKEEYPPSPLNPKNCIFKCPFYYYEYFGNKYCTGENECPSLAPFLNKEKLKCVEKCPKAAYYGVCYDSCPEKTYKYSGQNECHDIDNICSLSQFDNIREHLIDLINNDSSIVKKVQKYIKYFSYTNNHIDVYKH